MIDTDACVLIPLEYFDVFCHLLAYITCFLVEHNYCVRRFSIVMRNESNLHMTELVLDNATLKDNGTYQCYAENSVGYAPEFGQPYLIVHGEFVGLLSLVAQVACVMCLRQAVWPES